jgi:5S rRNA maturation endonuclease (ribonuclease M5)
VNAKQAKQLSFPDLLSKLGYTPTRTLKNGNELWYKSPLRGGAEKTASFHISYIRGQWLFYDFAENGGNIIDFAMRYKGISSFKDALAFLSEQFPNHGGRKETYKNPAQNSFSFHQQSGAAAKDFPEHQKEQCTERDLELVSVHPLTSGIVLSYLQNRGIPPELSKTYFQLVRYTNKNMSHMKTPFFAFGQKNSSAEGGYEIRSASDEKVFKSALIKAITIHAGSEQGRGEGKTINVFEGMLDHVSLCVVFGVHALRGDALILNATSLYQQAEDYITANEYQKINLFLDNDVTGKKTASKFKEKFGEIVTDYSQSYAPYKDVNEALMQNHHFDFSLPQNDYK